MARLSAGHLLGAFVRYGAWRGLRGKRQMRPVPILPGREGISFVLARAVQMQFAGIAAAGVDQHLADLHDRLDVRVVGNVGHDGLGVGAEGGLEGFDGFEEQVADGGIGRGAVRCVAGHAFVHGDALAGFTQFVLDHGHVLVAVVVHVETAAGGVGVEDADLDHGGFSGIGLVVGWRSRHLRLS